MEQHGLKQEMITLTIQTGIGQDRRRDDLTKDGGRRRQFIHEEMGHMWRKSSETRGNNYYKIKGHDNKKDVTKN